MDHQTNIMRNIFSEYEESKFWKVLRAPITEKMGRKGWWCCDDDSKHSRRQRTKYIYVFLIDGTGERKKEGGEVEFLSRGTRGEDTIIFGGDQLPASRLTTVSSTDCGIWRKKFGEWSRQIHDNLRTSDYTTLLESGREKSLIIGEGVHALYFIHLSSVKPLVHCTVTRLATGALGRDGKNVSFCVVLLKASSTGLRNPKDFTVPNCGKISQYQIVVYRQSME